MLQLTTAAAAQLADVRRQRGLPETFGVRVFGHPEGEGRMALDIQFVEFPSEDDAVSEEDGTRLFVAPEVAKSQVAPEGVAAVP